MKDEKYYPPKHAERQYHCPHCGVYSKQLWAYIQAGGYTWGNGPISHLDIENWFEERLDRQWTISSCQHCENKSIWFKGKMLYPQKLLVSQPNSDLSEEIQADYLEAAAVFNFSPRASAAILRLALQKLCRQLGERGENINHDIGELVRKGLNPQIQKSLDILRITGNNAVHPGEINLDEESDLVLKLFELINFIAEKMITEPKEINGFYEVLPESSREAVDERDG